MNKNRLLFFAILLFGGLTTKSAVALSLVSGTGLCLDVHAPDQFNDGGRVQVWECNNSQQQIWSFVNGTIHSGAGLCLDVHAPDQFKDGGRVQVWRCNNSQQQAWSFANGTLQSDAGLCLDVHAPDQFNNGGRVQVWGCNNSPQQKWQPRGPGIVGPVVAIPPTFVRPLPRPQQSPQSPQLFPLPEIARQTPAPPVLRLPQPTPGNIRVNDTTVRTLPLTVTGRGLSGALALLESIEPVTVRTMRLTVTGQGLSGAFGLLESYEPVTVRTLTLTVTGHGALSE